MTVIEDVCDRVIVLVAMLLMTGTTLRVEPVTTISIAGLAITSVLGLGFAAGGITVLYKRIGNWLNLLQFGFIVLISAPVFDAPWTRLLPLAHGSALLQRAMVDGTRLWQFSPFDLALLVGVTVGYSRVDTWCFTTRHGEPATRRSRRLLIEIGTNVLSAVCMGVR